MKVKSIELVNLKSHENTSIELSPNINLLTGANNSGKSTIIRALLNLQYQTLNTKDIRTLSQYAKTFVCLTDVSESDKLNLFFKGTNEVERGTDFTVAWGLSTGNNAEEILFYNSQHKVKRVKDHRIEFQDISKDKKTHFNDFIRFPDNENLNNFIYPFLAKRKTDYYDTNTGKDQTFKVSETLRYLAAKIIKINSSKSSDRYNKLCEEILGFRVGVIPTDNNQNGNEPGIYSINSSMISIRSMGEGVANIVGFIVILLTENNKLFLIEELENDIHPKALKMLLDLIIEKAANNQFIISTHSNIVLKYLCAVSKSKLFYCEWKPKIKVQGNDEDIPTSLVQEIENKPEKRVDILRKLGYEFFDFELHQSYLILEESSAEAIIRDFLIPNFVPNLYGKIKTIAAKGVEDLEIRVIDFNRLFVFIHSSPIYFKKAWVIADGDDVGINCIKSLQNSFTTWHKKHFLNWHKKNFEEYYPDVFTSQVQQILEMPHGKKKQTAKKELLIEVMTWALNNRELAIKEFKKSALEVINILKRISSQILKTQQ